jgi:tetratricopeptide (TPR) repeat protein
MSDTATIYLHWPSLPRLSPRKWALLALGSLAFTACRMVRAGHRRREEYRVAKRRAEKARAAFENGHYPLAIAQGKLALLTYEEQLPPSHPSVLEAKNRLILAYKANRETGRALALVRTAFRRNMPIVPDNRVEAALLAATCSSVLATQGKTEEAITGYEKALELLGEDSEHYSAISAELQTLKATM